ncbi:MAG: FGGY-family carbohydrate kinase, partial [Clostridia bacterium]|nr:FGGY-family carbohydrate kinase [Clostridia bacterium]
KYFTLVSAYLNYKLSGRLCDCTASQASRLPYNYKKERWQKSYELTCTVYNVEEEKLCELVKPGEVIGKISKEVAEITGIPEGLEIIATGSDKACETLGTGALRKDTASLSFGTTATLQITTKKYVEPQRYMPAYNSVVRGYFNPEIQIFRGFWMVTWFKKQFGHEEAKIAEDIGVPTEQVLDKSLTEIPAGCNGLMLQPYWAPGLKIPEAKGTIIGFNDCHTKAHVYKSIVEGIGYALYEGLVYLEKKSRQKISKISVSGGGSQSDAICKITADMFGRPVYRVQTYETSGLGAAMIAFVAKGEFENFEECNKAMVHFKDEFKPNMQNYKIYKNLF